MQWEDPVWVRRDGVGSQHCEWRGRKTLFRTTGKTFHSTLRHILFFLILFCKCNNYQDVLYSIHHPAQTIIETHGEGVVESLVPVFVWVLEGLASCKAQLRDREEEAERERAEREELLDRYQAERTLRKESQEVQSDFIVLIVFCTQARIWTFECCKSRWL